MQKGYYYKKSFTTVEAILSIALLFIITLGLGSSLAYSVSSVTGIGNLSKATLLANEGIEAIKNIRDNSFATLVAGTYSLTTTGNAWGITAGSQVIDGLTRQITISDINSTTKEVLSSVSWSSELTGSQNVSQSMRITDWLRSVPLPGDWTNPSIQSNLDLTDNSDGLFLSVIGNYAYVARAGSTNNFVVVDISNLATPSQVGITNATGTITDMAVNGNYAYLTGTGNSSELMVIDITTPASPSVVFTYNAPGNNNYNGVTVSGNRLYATRSGGSDDFNVFDLTNPAAPSFMASISTPGNDVQVKVLGSYAYSASSDNSTELHIIDTTNSLAPSHAASLNLPGNNNATLIEISGNTLFITQSDILYSINITNPLIPTQLGSLDVGNTVLGLTINSAQTYAYVSSNSPHFKVVSFSTPSSLSIVGSTTYSSSTLNEMDYAPAIDRVLGTGNANSAELTIFRPN